MNTIKSDCYFKDSVMEIFKSIESAPADMRPGLAYDVAELVNEITNRIMNYAEREGFLGRSFSVYNFEPHKCSKCGTWAYADQLRSRSPDEWTEGELHNLRMKNESS